MALYQTSTLLLCYYISSSSSNSRPSTRIAVILREWNTIGLPLVSTTRPLLLTRWWDGSQRTGHWCIIYSYQSATWLTASWFVGELSGYHTECQLAHIMSRCSSLNSLLYIYFLLFLLGLACAVEECINMPSLKKLVVDHRLTKVFNDRCPFFRTFAATPVKRAASLHLRR